MNNKYLLFTAGVFSTIFGVGIGLFVVKLLQSGNAPAGLMLLGVCGIIITGIVAMFIEDIKS